MGYPEINKRVLAWIENEEYPFVGYWDGDEWLMEVENLDCDVHRNTIYGKVIEWIDLPERKTTKGE